MKILGITAEYNPFHNGHKYHLERSMEQTGADYSIAVMSGNFTQRGEIAILDKWTRSRIAVENGVDLVIELPFVFACARGEIFASGAVDILRGMGVTDIAFGSESGEMDRLKALVEDMTAGSGAINMIRRRQMKEGYSYVKASQLAVERVLGKEKAAIITEPNNILAVEYLKRIAYWRKRGHIMEPHTVKRYGSGYHDLDQETGFAGASAIRSMLEKPQVTAKELERYMPENAAKAAASAGDIKETEKRAFMLLKSELVKNSSSELSMIYCMGEGLENKFKKEIIGAGSMEEFIDSMVSRRYTKAAVRRLIIYVLMGLKEYDPAGRIYGRVLAAGERGRELLRLLKKRELASIPVISNINKESDTCEAVWETLKYDVLASDMYNIIRDRSLYEFSDNVVTPYMR